MPIKIKKIATAGFISITNSTAQWPSRVSEKCLLVSRKYVKEEMILLENLFGLFKIM